ncbi:DUF5666 domain-containing protein [Polaromonas sp. P1(28)-13]|nr:DUF5666 domain-containing protein [Polaromonas sp. P1(28)-13]
MAGRPRLGGTGISEGGIGGTGIVGVITGFASICVNGVEVHFDAGTPVSDNGQPGSARQLAVGQVVAVRAAGAGAEVSARNIAGNPRRGRATGGARRRDRCVPHLGPDGPGPEPGRPVRPEGGGLGAGQRTPPGAGRDCHLAHRADCRRSRRRS